MVLAGILVVYSLWPSVGIGASSAAGMEGDQVFAAPTWASLLQDAQAIRMVVVTSELDRVPESIAGGWSLPIKQLSAEVGALVASRSAVGIDDDALQALNTHTEALANLELAGVTAGEIGSALDGLIVELDHVAEIERGAMVERLESANRFAVRALGTRALMIASTAFVASSAVLGLGAGVHRLVRADVPPARVALNRQRPWRGG